VKYITHSAGDKTHQKTMRLYTKRGYNNNGSNIMCIVIIHRYLIQSKHM